MSESKNEQSTESSPVSKGIITVEVFGRTDVGLVREHNEDNFLVADLTAGNRSIRPEVRTHTVGPKGSIFTVCDGMGGAAAGEVASQIGVDTIYDMMQQGNPPEDDYALAQRLEKALCEAGRRILTAARLNRTQRGMGTTVTAAVLIGPRLIVGQVGDSRAYILRNGQLVQITKDQSLVQQLIDAKQMTEEEAKTFDKNNIILQALGTAEEVHVDVTSAILKRGDMLVMCSDGLSGLVDNDTIRDTVLGSTNPVEACRMLTEKACDAGGHDNITVIVGTFAGDGLELPPEDGAVDEDLIYDRFQFSRASETTSRSFRPTPDKSASSREDTVRLEDPTPKPKDKTPEPEPVEEPKEDKKSRAPLWGAIAAAAVLLVVIIAYLSSGDATEESAAVNPVQVAPSPTSESGSSKPSLTTAREPVEEPPLPPTPEEAIMKKEDSRSSKSSRHSERGASEDLKEEEPPESPEADKPSKLTRPPENPYDDDKPSVPEPEPEPEKKASDEKAEDSSKTPKQPSTRSKSDPKPIDDNPF